MLKIEINSEILNVIAIFLIASTFLRPQLKLVCCAAECLNSF